MERGYGEGLETLVSLTCSGSSSQRCEQGVGAICQPCLLGHPAPWRDEYYLALALTVDVPNFRAGSTQNATRSPHAQTQAQPAHAHHQHVRYISTECQISWHVAKSGLATMAARDGNITGAAHTQSQQAPCASSIMDEAQ